MTVATPDERAALVRRLQQLCGDLLQEFPEHREYIELQESWNAPTLEYAARWMPARGARLCSIGSFLGAPEIALAASAEEVVCCDMNDWLPKSRPANVHFHALNVDTAQPAFPDGMFDACFVIEVLEHLRWSPLPLLQWARDQCNLLVISTPDDREWPAVENAAWTTRSHFKDIPVARKESPGNPEPMSHCKQYSQHEFVELLDYSGFRVVEMQRVGGGGHQMLAIAQVRVEDRGWPLLPVASAPAAQAKARGWRAALISALGGKLPQEGS